MRHQILRRTYRQGADKLGHWLRNNLAQVGVEIDNHSIVLRIIAERFIFLRRRVGDMDAWFIDDAGLQEIDKSLTLGRFGIASCQAEPNQYRQRDDDLSL